MRVLESILGRISKIWADFRTPNLGGSVFVGLVTLLLTVSPAVWAYKVYDRTAGVSAWANNRQVEWVEKFAHAFDQYLLIGLALAVASGLNWFENYLDSKGKYRLGWQAGVSTAFCFLGGLGTFFFGYLSYIGSFATIEKHYKYFETELLFYFFGMLVVMFSYILSIIEIRRVKDKFSTDVS